MSKGTVFSLEVKPKLPRRLARLEELANNLWYSWDRPTRTLFSRLDTALWEAVGHNPKAFLKRVDERKLIDAADDPVFLGNFNRALSAFDTYHSEPLRRNGSEWLRQSDLVAYFCAEFGFHESLPIYSGGLGILAGDHCKSASDMRLPFIGVGLLYRKGYFRQSIDADGHQEHDREQARRREEHHRRAVHDAHRGARRRHQRGRRGRHARHFGQAFQQHLELARDVVLRHAGIAQQQAGLVRGSSTVVTAQRPGQDAACERCGADGAVVAAFRQAQHEVQPGGALVRSGGVNELNVRKTPAERGDRHVRRGGIRGARWDQGRPFRSGTRRRVLHTCFPERLWLRF